MTTFEDVEHRYCQTVECLLHNHMLALDNSPPRYAQWYHHPTMIRWLYGSSMEFVADFNKISTALTKIDEYKRPIFRKRKSLNTLLWLFKSEIGKKFTCDDEIMKVVEALE
ncbi:MAG TPA: hypothetical protein VJK03_01755 [Candidatus Nanoarchaeia archaeon]|nr:hypothetical protein [Candidatus Nanoarchaeia archaeon]